MVAEAIQERAWRAVADQLHDTVELVEFSRQLIQQEQFGLARRVLAVAADRPEGRTESKLRTKIVLQRSTATYKDPDLHEGERLDMAFQILEELGPVDDSTNPDVLGIAGTIYKRKWMLYGRRADLVRALTYFLNGYMDLGVDVDVGFNGINAAFVLDVLGTVTAAEAPDRLPLPAVDHFGNARYIRERVLQDLARRSDEPLLQSSFWFLAMLAEATFGLGRFDEAQHWLTQAAALPAGEHDLESLTRQLVALAQLINAGSAVEDNAWRVLGVFTGRNPNELRASFSGRYGLALSGGGFRAALFHIGVLAKLAELDMLRHVQVISCVSGGAIVGSHYYLELRRLLQTKNDSEITREDYIAIVQRLERDFLAAIQRNLVSHAFASVGANLASAFLPHYSRALRFGELIESEILARVADSPVGPMWLNELGIQPQGERAGFLPRSGNWRRAAKVPALVINATTLNTGHNWQFTSTWMGEPAANIDQDLDANARLRRVFYAEAPPRYQKVRLGTAIAASACNVGFFDPVEFPGLYPDYTVSLVDGGWHDNQGVGALFEQDCTVLLVSDASGQLSTVKAPGLGFLEVATRGTEILVARVREAQYREMDARRRASPLAAVMLLHLKKDFVRREVDWIGASMSPPKSRPPPRTSYGVAPSVQEALAEMRSNYDAFSDVEAFSLMASGYMMAGRGVPMALQPHAAVPPVNSETSWRFLIVRESLTRPAEAAGPVLGLLQAQARLARVLGITSTAVPFAAAALMVWLLDRIVTLPDSRSLLVGGLAVGVAALISIGVPLLKKRVGQILFALFMALFGWVGSHLRLHVLDPFYLKRGRMGDLESRRTQRASDTSPVKRVLSREHAVEQVSKMFALAGYGVKRATTGLPELGSIDLIAFTPQEQLCVQVCTPDDEGYVDWTAASRIKRATWMLAEAADSLPGQAVPQLVLVDTRASSSLLAFAERERVRIVLVRQGELYDVIAAKDASAARRLLASSPARPLV